ncbi:MAG: RluA family pseudouridine synthase [Kordiimonadaceae bacterium]|nr:RluA family pseudouridine synthase [Kordiimonadaceae bacterium]MBO6569821.1 RluA family pseudouridine synthase [Kordiimonadaceae bacterium]MBO6966083.1 RluA family pseudouridine synthase [Kordiimonadaceae bacterium]
MSGVQNIEVKPDDDDVRIDRWFKRHFPGVSFGQLQKIMRKGEVRLDGKRVKGKERVFAGQIVRVPPLGDSANKPAPKNPRPRLSDRDIKEVRSWVVYEDESVIAINKPAGLPTQGGTGQSRHVDGLLDALRGNTEHRPKLVHRLDKDTSGALLLGRTPKAAAMLAKAFQSRETDKRYWALVAGTPKERDGRISVRMDKVAAKGHERMVVSADGKPSLTDYSVIESAGQMASWLALKPHTGRTHQLRLHCAEMGHPIVGDGKYGGQAAFLTGAISRKLHLHSRFITFPHPDGGMLTVTAPMPDHMTASFDFLGFTVGDYDDPDFE